MSSYQFTGVESLAVQATSVEINATSLIMDAFSHVQAQLPISVMTVKDYSEKIFDKTREIQSS